LKPNIPPPSSSRESIPLFFTAQNFEVFRRNRGIFPIDVFGFPQKSGRIFNPQLH
jgi:hypothetical protein